MAGAAAVYCDCSIVADAITLKRPHRSRGRPSVAGSIYCVRLGTLREPSELLSRAIWQRMPSSWRMALNRGYRSSLIGCKRNLERRFFSAPKCCAPYDRYFREHPRWGSEGHRQELAGTALVVDDQAAQFD